MVDWGRRGATLCLLLPTLALAGCAGMGQTQLQVSAQNESGSDLAVVVTFLSDSTGETEVDLGVVSAQSFSIKEKEISAGDYRVRVVAGGLEHEEPWTLSAGEQGLTVRISETSIQLINVPGGG